MRRRDVLRLGLYGGSAIALPSCSSETDAERAPAVAFTLPLVIPPVLEPESTDSTTDYYRITMRPGSAQVRSGPPTEIWGYNGIWPGPTIKAARGRRVVVEQVNGLPVDVVVHNHGHTTDASSDGYPMDFVAPGASKKYVYPNDQGAATYWYHDHTMDKTGAQVYRGLAGFYLIEDDAEQSLGLPSGAYDIPLMIQDRTLSEANALVYDVPGVKAFLGDITCVNGVWAPYLHVAGRKYRFRLLNGCNARELYLKLSKGSLVLIGSDGGLLPAPVSRSDEVQVVAGERFDCVIDFSPFAVGTSVMLEHDGDPILRFDVVAEEADPSQVPMKLLDTTLLAEGDAALTRKFTLDVVGAHTYINGKPFDPSRIDADPKLGTIEVWEVVNKTDNIGGHPFHTHLARFQVLAVDGKPPPDELRGWKDTVNVPYQGSIKIIMSFDTFSGLYVFHCHKLEHADHGMMAQMQIGA